MILTRKQFFVLGILVLVAPWFIYKALWIATSTKTNGIVLYNKEVYLRSMPQSCPIIQFKTNNEVIEFAGDYNLSFKEGDSIAVRYHTSSPENAKAAVFVSLWMNTIVYASIPLLVWLILFIAPGIIPKNSRVVFSKRKWITFIAK